jgi:hypothetical protein
MLGPVGEEKPRSQKRDLGHPPTPRDLLSEGCPEMCALSALWGFAIADIIRPLI